MNAKESPRITDKKVLERPWVSEGGGGGDEVQ